MKQYSIAILLFWSSSVIGTQDFGATEEIEPTCPNSNFFQKIVSETCWGCFFPIQAAGVRMGSPDLEYNRPFDTGSGSPPVQSSSIGPDMPSDANTDAFCTCQDNLGLPEFGFTFGSWLPVNVIELVRMPYCSPTLGGVRLTDELRYIGGNKNDGGAGPQNTTMYHYHYFAYPLMFMLDMLSEPECNPGGYFDFDLMYLSELDPTWNEDELAVIATPEIAIFSNPLAIAACIGDSVAATAGYPIDSLFWCAGTWGGMYPFSGTVPANGSPPKITSLLAARVVALMHRRGLAYGTVGTSNMCDASFEPMIRKTQYKLNQTYPMPEANGNHWIGQSPLTWGEWRNIPAVGEDFVHVLWRWTDCCIR